MKNLWNMKVIVISVVVGILETAFINMKKRKDWVNEIFYSLSHIDKE